MVIFAPLGKWVLRSRAQNYIWNIPIGVFGIIRVIYIYIFADSKPPTKWDARPSML